MQRARQQLLAGAALAEQQRRDVGRRDLLDHAADGQHALAGGDDAVQRRFVDLVLQASILRFQLGNVERAIDQQLERVRVDRLLVEIVGALGDRRQGIFLVAVAGDDDHLGVRRQPQRFGQRRETLLDALGLGRQTEILQHDGRLAAPELRYCVLAILGREHVVALEAPFQLLQQAGVILDDQQFAGLFAHPVLSDSLWLDRQWCHEAATVGSRWFTSCRRRLDGLTAYVFYVVANNSYLH